MQNIKVKVGSFHFSCQRCSKCCRFTPGYVFLTQNDLNSLIKITGLHPLDFINQYTRIIDLDNNRFLSLKEKDNLDCILWDKGCIYYENRPVQCRTYPFWMRIVENFTVFNEYKNSCPGIGQGKLYSEIKIKKLVSLREDNRILTESDIKKYQKS